MTAAPPAPEPEIVPGTSIPVPADPDRDPAGEPVTDPDDDPRVVGPE